ncbi:MAG: pitrilysin family protein [Bacteroidales bacterium]|nr:pitrilysin family protein [Bacteroidales bacterium]
MIAFPDIPGLLEPERIGPVCLFRSSATDLLKLDFVFEAGSYFQPQLLTAVATAKLMTVATRTMDAQRLSEFLDARGIVAESTSNLFTSCLTFYTHRRYADELLPVVAEMLREPALTEGDFEVWRSAKRQELAVHQQRSSTVARRLWYQALFGTDHPLGHAAAPEDADRLQLDVVRDYFRRHYPSAPCHITLSGAVDEQLIDMLNTNTIVPSLPLTPSHSLSLPLPPPSSLLPPHSPLTAHLPTSQQTSIRIGRILPHADSIPFEDSARLALCTSLLGGYFGSRLMSNLREDKGFTYGVSAHIQPYRGCRVFFIASDVAAGTADEAIREALGELQRLADTPPSHDELDTVKSILAGDAMRMLDGVFERSDRYCDLIESGPVDLYDPRFPQVLHDTTPEQVSSLINKYLAPDSMLCCQAGVVQ